MKNFEELMSQFQKIDIEKEIREKRLIRLDEAFEHTRQSKIYPEYITHYQLHSELFGDEDNPFELDVKIINHNCVNYVLKENLKEEIERMSETLTLLSEISNKCDDLMKLCTV